MWSSESGPAITPNIAASSAALRAITPTWSRLHANSKTPKRLPRPEVGLLPVRPVAAHGQRIDPPVSEAGEPVPAVVWIPLVQKRSLIPIGMPSSGAYTSARLMAQGLLDVEYK